MRSTLRPFCLVAALIGANATPLSSTVVVAGNPVDGAVRLHVVPPKIPLDARRASQQMVVSAEFSDGSFADVTDQVSWHIDEVGTSVVSLDGDHVHPVGPGTTQVVVRFEGLEASAEVVVSQLPETQPVDFRTEVISAISRSGCNQGACHGSPQGKGGFRLSLRGFDPSLDIQTLTREASGRRVNLADPGQSLILLKGGGRVPHQGGIRFRQADVAYQTLKRWIAEGATDSSNPRELQRLEVAPSRRTLRSGAPTQQIVVRAHFSNGAVEDVTDYVAFSLSDENSAAVSPSGEVSFPGTGEVGVLVRYLDRIETAELSYVRRDENFRFPEIDGSTYVDEHVFAKQRELQLIPAPRASDGVFLRRVYLDVIGAIPTPEEVVAFLDSKDPDKRDKLIDDLLSRPEFAEFWALKWADVMRVSSDQLTERGVHNFHRFLVEAIEEDRSFAGVARDILTSLGNTIHHPTASFYRVARTPEDAAEAFSQLFLGVRIQCAKCHNHPYESITQRDYYSLAAYFARVKLKGKRFGLDDETVMLADTGEVKFPVTGEVVAPAAFGTPIGELGATADRREKLADWLESPENPYFARSVMNRVWFHLVGKPIVEPVDDFRDSNLPSNGALLEALSEDFIRSGYRFRPVMRAILRSQTYQRSAQFEGRQSTYAAVPDRYFTQGVIRMLSAEQILDAVSMATGVPERLGRYPLGTRATALAETIDHKFLQAFSKPIRDVTCDCARETEPTLNQVVQLMNNSSLLDKTESAKGRLGRALDAGRPTDEIVELLYVATLSRRPTSAEKELVSRHLAESESTAAGLRDVQHVLLNSNEFLLRH